jgi:hypothetical protein
VKRIGYIDGRRVSLADDHALSIGTGKDIALNWDGTRLNVTQLAANSEIRWGVDGAGIDHRWYGDTVGAYMLWDQSEDKLDIVGSRVDITNTVLGAAEIGLDCRVTVAAPSNQLGMSGYFQADINGTTTGQCYGLGSWINTGPTAPVLAAGHIITPFEGGVYTGEAQAAARIVFAGQHQAVLNGAPASLHAWRLNTTQTIDALIAAANAGSVGYAAAAGTTSNKVGDLPLADVVGHGVRYVRLYDAAG